MEQEGSASSPVRNATDEMKHEALRRANSPVRNATDKSPCGATGFSAGERGDERDEQEGGIKSPSNLPAFL